MSSTPTSHPNPPPQEGRRPEGRNSQEAPAPTRPKGRGWIKLAIKGVVGPLVIVAVARHAIRTWRDLGARGESIHVAPGLFALAVVLYVLGLVPLGVYYWRVLAASPTPIGPYAAIRAYLISHLGKYVPGKALVVVMRAGLSAEAGARGATAAFATLYETLVMMAAGGLVAAVGFVWGGGGSVPLWSLNLSRSVEAPLSVLGLGMGLVFLVVVLPRVFPRLAGTARLPFPGVGPDALPRVSVRLLAEGLALSALGWTLLGLSQVAILGAIGVAGLPGSAWPTAVASVALATVAGFAVPVAPGGLGVREMVLWTALASAVDLDRAVVAALVLRLAWVVGEVLIASILFLIRPEPTTRPPAP